MPNLDFDGLRADVEARTRVPDFDAVHKRANRIRLRDRLLVLLAVVSVVAVAAPAGVGVWRMWPSRGVSQVIGPDRPGPDSTEQPPTPEPSPSTSRAKVVPVAAVRALGGIDLEHLYAAVDVCAGDACSLQVSLVPLRPGDQRPPVVVGQLRDDTTTRLDGLQLTSLSPTALLLSGVPGAGPRRYAQVNVPRTATDFAGGASEPSPPGGAVRALAPDDRVTQLQEFGPLYGARAVDDELTRLATQPPLVAPTVASAIPPTYGWWATGSDPNTDELSVAVSRDRGRSWTTRGLGPAGPGEVPVVATLDGRTVYVFARAGTPDTGGVAGWRTDDGGLSWQRLDVRLPQRPEVGATGGRTKLGAVVRPDGSILLWSGDGATPAYLESTDGGQSFHRTPGPSGRVVLLSDGFATMGMPPGVSRDGRTWTPVTSPAYLPPA